MNLAADWWTLGGLPDEQPPGLRPDTGLQEALMPTTSISREAGRGPAGRADPARPSVDHTLRFMRAASEAIHVYPGPVGQLLQREILTHLELGHRVLDATALIPRIVDDILDGSREAPWSPDRRTLAACPSALATERRGPGSGEAYCFEV